MKHKEHIFATHKDGSIVRINSRVMVVATRSGKAWGRVLSIGDLRVFHSLRYRKLQTYVVRTDAGRIVTVHAGMIKYAVPPSKNVVYINHAMPKQATIRKKRKLK